MVAISKYSEKSFHTTASCKLPEAVWKVLFDKLFYLFHRAAYLFQFNSYSWYWIQLTSSSSSFSCFSFDFSRKGLLCLFFPVLLTLLVQQNSTKYFNFNFFVCFSERGLILQCCRTPCELWTKIYRKNKTNVNHAPGKQKLFNIKT